MMVAKPGVMPMERLTAEDQLMLWPDEIWPQDIGALALLDGSSLLDPDGRFRIGDVRDRNRRAVGPRSSVPAAPLRAAATAGGAAVGGRSRL
jgi:hypothetical protein